MSKLYVNDRKLDELILAAKLVLEGLENLGLAGMNASRRLTAAVRSLTERGDGD